MTVFLARDVIDTGKQMNDDAEEIEIIRLPVEGFHDALCSLQDKVTFIDLKTPGLFELAKNVNG